MYGKFFASTFTGSMFGAGSTVFAVWGYVIANTVDARVELNPKLLASILGAAVADIDTAIELLCQPDPASRNPQAEGRRLQREGQYQYRVTSHEIYRAIRNEEERRAYNREKQRESRKRKKQKDNSQSTQSLTVIESQSLSALSAHTEADTDTEEDLRSINKLVRGGSPHTTSEKKPPPAPLKPPNGNGNDHPPITARSKRPIFTGQRLTVFEWMLDDCAQTLGPLTDAFDLHAWFFVLDAELVKAAIVLQKRDGGVWLQSQLVAEAQRRGLPIAVATPPPSKRSAQLAHTVATIAREEAEKRAAHK